MKISIDNLVFMTDDEIVFTEGVDEYDGKFEKKEFIEPIIIFHQENGLYYARGGRHRTYMFYYRKDLREIEVDILKNFKLDEVDKTHIKNGCITIKDLKEEPL